VRSNSQVSLQVLAASGTVAVVLQAPGYQDLRIPVVLRPSGLTLRDQKGAASSAIGVGGGLRLRAVMTQVAPMSIPRPGLEIPLDFTTEPAGIVSLDKTRVIVSSVQPAAEIQVRGRRAWKRADPARRSAGLHDLGGT
jgi:hypothetical protein